MFLQKKKNLQDKIRLMLKKGLFTPFNLDMLFKGTIYHRYYPVHPATT